MKDLKNEMAKNRSPWEEDAGLRKAADKIYEAGMFQLQEINRMKFFITTNVKELESKKYKVMLVKDLLKLYMPETDYIIAIDRLYWNDLDETDKIYVIAHCLLHCGAKESGEPCLLQPDIKEYKELMVSDYIDLKKLVEIVDK